MSKVGEHLRDTEQFALFPERHMHYSRDHASAADVSTGVMLTAHFSKSNELTTHNASITTPVIPRLPGQLANSVLATLEARRSMTIST
jgi:hypothetical protein